MTGAFGVLGRHVADVLQEQGHDVVWGSRSPGPGRTPMDVTDPGSLRRVVQGTDAVVHCAASPTKPRQVEVDAIPVMRTAAPRARIVYPSIVGCDRISFPYYQVKLAGERALARAGGDFAILRLTQFHELVDRLARLPLPMVPLGMRAQTIAASEAAALVAELVDSEAQGLAGEVGGPEIHPMLDLVKARLRADGRMRPVVRLPFGTAGFRAGYNLVPAARAGRITWAEHLAGT